MFPTSCALPSQVTRGRKVKCPLHEPIDDDAHRMQLIQECKNCFEVCVSGRTQPTRIKFCVGCKGYHSAKNFKREQAKHGDLSEPESLPHLSPLRTRQLGTMTDVDSSVLDDLSFSLAPIPERIITVGGGGSFTPASTNSSQQGLQLPRTALFPEMSDGFGRRAVVHHRFYSSTHNDEETRLPHVSAALGTPSSSTSSSDQQKRYSSPLRPRERASPLPLLHRPTCQNYQRRFNTMSGALSLNGREFYGCALETITDASQHAACNARAEELGGGNTAETLTARHKLADALYRSGKMQQAEDMFHEVFAARMSLLGPRHVNTLATQLGRANAVAGQGKLSAAENLYREVLDGLLDSSSPQSLGPDHHITIGAFFGIAAVWNTMATHQSNPEAASGLASMAQEVMNAAWVRRCRLLGFNHVDTVHARHGSALAMETQG